MADETSHQCNNDKRWMWAALSHDVAFFKINNQHAAKRLLGETVSYILVTDQYSVYKYIDESKRQLCWAHILRNVIAIEESVSPEKQYYRRLRRLRKSWLHWLKLGSYQCSKRYRGRRRNLIAAERVLRNYILMRKCCYVTCSYRGDQFRERMLSLIETAKLQQKNLLKFLTQEICGEHRNLLSE